MEDVEDAEEVVLAHGLASITRPRQFYRMACPFGPHNSPLDRITVIYIEKPSSRQDPFGSVYG